MFTEENGSSEENIEKIQPNISSKKDKSLIIFGLIYLSLTVVFSSMNERITRPFLQVYMYDTLTLSTVFLHPVLMVTFPLFRSDRG